MLTKLRVSGQAGNKIPSRGKLQYWPNCLSLMSSNMDGLWWPATWSKYWTMLAIWGDFRCLI